MILRLALTAMNKSIENFDSPQKVEFTIDHLLDIRSAIVCLLDVVATIIKTLEGNPPTSYSKIQQECNVVLSEELFQGLRNRYLWWSATFNNPVTHQRPQLRYSRLEADRFIKCLVSSFESCRFVLNQALQRRSLNESKLNVEIKKVKAELTSCQSQLSLAENKLATVDRERGVWLSRMDELNQRLLDAQRRISTLEKNKSALSWQRHHNEMVTKQQQETEEHDSAILKLREEKEKGFEAMRQKIKKLENEVGKLRLKSELYVAPSTGGLLHKLEYKKREVYLRDQEIQSLRSEMMENRKQMAGCLGGMVKDYRCLLQKWENENPGRKFSPDPDKVKLQAKLHTIHQSLINDNLQMVLPTLPNHYAPIDVKINKHSPPTNDPPNPTPPTNLRSNSFDTRASHRAAGIPKILRPHSARGDFPQNIPNDITDKSPSTPHPHLVSKVTGRANLHLVLKHFPYLTVEQVSKQWENFRRFDKNNDFKLDLPELYEAVGGHGKVTVNEIREAMREVDRDQSNNIDFYEYLKISEMIFKNQGDSAIFKSGLLHHNGSASSEACVLQ